MIEKFSLINPDHLTPGTRFLKKFENPCFKGKEEFYFKKANHLIIYIRKLVTWKKPGIIETQIEIPASAIQWIVDTIEIKFFKPHAQGGLPIDKFHYIEKIEGEELMIARGVSIGGENIAGYKLINLSRNSYILTTSKQEFAMPDPFLFEHGLMDFLKDLGAKISEGKI
ncbi:MAG: hypothetical protein VR64_00830 [Desulfatitalea sp. BRH_c12]|nr:MAG: hypothetical protein VR64_00830 [Desulfatitalea sp. BRH_c12]